MPKTKKQLVGNFGEDVAVKFLRENGYTVKDRNIHLSHNELDIVAEDDNYIVFIEVKTRSYANDDGTSDYGTPGMAVDRKKRDDTVKASRAYLAKHRTKKQPRIDVIEVYLKQSENVDEPKVIKINHIRNAFGANGKKY